MASGNFENTTSSPAENSTDAADIATEASANHAQTGPNRQIQAGITSAFIWHHTENLLKSRNIFS